MHTKHVWLRTDEQANLLDVPKLPPYCRIEAILLVEDSGAGAAVRVPPAELASVTRIHGDLLEPAVALED